MSVVFRLIDPVVDLEPIAVLKALRRQGVRLSGRGSEVLPYLTYPWVLASVLGFLKEGTEGVDGDAEGAAGEAIHVSGVDADDFASGIENGAAAAAVGGGGVVDEFVADDVAEMSAGSGGTNQRQGGQLTGRADVVVAIGHALIDSSGGFGDHPGNAHGIADHGNELSRSAGRLGEGQRGETANQVGIFSVQDGEIGSLRHRCGRQIYGRGRTGEKNHETFKHPGGSLLDEFLGLRVSVPGLGYVTVGGQQAVAHKESCARNAGANDGALVRETNLIDTVNVSDGIAVAVEHDGGHGLVLLELFDLCRQFVDLLLQIAGGLCLGGRGSVIVDHGEGSQEEHDSHDGLHDLLPAVDDGTGFL